METEYRVHEITELESVAADALTQYKERNNTDTAFVLALHGDLGAGKTTFMQILARQLGVSEQVTSPTFVVMKKYPAEDGGAAQLVHIDAYRIEDVDEMRPLRFSEELTKKDTIIGIEWAENIEPLLPAGTLHLTFTLEGETRIIHVKKEGQ